MNDKKPIRPFASRMDWDLGVNRLTRARDALLADGAPLLDLTESNPSRCALGIPAVSLAAALAREEGFIYRPDPLGSLQAREAIAALYRAKGVSHSPDRIMLTASTSEAYSFLFRLLADPGDGILLPAPSYPLLDHLARINDLTLDRYPLLVEEGFALEPSALESAVRPRDRAVLVVNPGNPSGVFLKRSELAAITALCARTGMAIIADEVFGDYGRGEDRERVAALPAEGAALTFSLGGISKMLALPQLKLSWIVVAGPADRAAEAIGHLEVIADSYLSVNTPAQTALPVLLEHRAAIQSAIRGRIEANRAAIEIRAAAPHPCRCLASEGGWYAVLAVPRTLDEEEWAVALLQEEGVMVHPGYYYDFPRDGYLVISLLPPEEVFLEAIDRMLVRLAIGH
jgi:hypothetical protein